MKQSNSFALTMSLLSFIGVLVLLFLQWPPGSKKIAYVETSRLVSNYQGMIEARESYQKKAAVWSANIDTLKQEVDSLIQDFGKEEKTLNRKEKNLRQALIQSKQSQLANYQEAVQAKAQQEDARMTREVIAAINGYLQTYAKQNGLDLILGTTPDGNIAYAEEAMNVTDELLKQLNQTVQ
ncbi:MAG: OmpH family outer membrane protein [Bacteroidota bacterium]